MKKQNIMREKIPKRFSNVEPYLLSLLFCLHLAGLVVLDWTYTRISNYRFPIYLFAPDIDKFVKIE